jgi:hypothetical protein
MLRIICILMLGCSQVADSWLAIEEKANSIIQYNSCVCDWSELPSAASAAAV